jgi:hypothetical protein
MDLEWKEIFQTLLEGADEIAIFTYRLSDGSYIMAEELSYNNIIDAIAIDLPVSLNKHKNGQFVLDRWMFQGEWETENGIATEPISLLVDNIIARSKAPINLKETYIRYNFFDKLSNTLDSEEFESLFEELSSTNLDKKDTTSDPLLDMYNKRIQYPYQN